MLSYLSRRRSSHGNSSRSSNSSPQSALSSLGHHRSNDSSSCISSNSSGSTPPPKISSQVAHPRKIFGRRKNNNQEGISSRTVPIETVRALLIGEIDPVELAREILPAKDLAAVIAYNRTPYRPALDLKRHDIRTAEDVLFVGLCYVGFEGRRQNVSYKVKQGRFCAHFKLVPQTVLDVWNWFNENDEKGIEFKRLLYSLNFLKLCKYHFL
jgi:hypothetical protein